MEPAAFFADQMEQRTSESRCYRERKTAIAKREESDLFLPFIRRSG